MKKGKAVGVDDIPSKFLADVGGGGGGRGRGGDGPRMVNRNFQ